ncbi:hypothetical protein [Spartinivicinus ruber]|uniref:hypothetical protein n=1 Tax=Spartinivicinus ruber TaxID=2683272 RepID=UPI0013D0A819|nr:hypothetical protein [Spartinivicinus ruber]
MRKETLWAVLIVTTVFTAGVIGVGWDSWITPNAPLPSPDDSLVNQKDDLNNDGPATSSQQTNSTKVGISDSRDSKQTADTRGAMKPPADVNPDKTVIQQSATATSSEKQNKKSAGQRTRIIVKDPVVLDGVDVVAELKGKELSAEDAIKAADE